MKPYWFVFCVVCLFGPPGCSGSGPEESEETAVEEAYAPEEEEDEGAFEEGLE